MNYYFHQVLFYCYFYITAFHLAVIGKNIDIVKLFLANEKTDLNCHTKEKQIRKK